MATQNSTKSRIQGIYYEQNTIPYEGFRYNYTRVVDERQVGQNFASGVYFTFNNGSLNQNNFTYNGNSPVASIGSVTNSLPSNWVVSCYLATYTLSGTANTYLRLYCVVNPAYQQQEGNVAQVGLLYDTHTTLVCTLGNDTYRVFSTTDPFDISNTYVKNWSTTLYGQWVGASSNYNENLMVTLTGDLTTNYYGTEGEALTTSLSLVGTALSSMVDFFDTPLFGGLTIGATIAIPLTLTLIVTIIRGLQG